MVALKAALTFRVLLALSTSASVTAAVAGPMAYQAAKAREVQVVQPAPTTTVPPTTPPPTRVVPGIVTTTSTSTTTTTTTTTLPDQPVPTTGVPQPPPLVGTGLFWSTSPDHAKPVQLIGGLGGYRVWVFVEAPSVQSVTFWWDDPTGAGVPAGTAIEAPFDVDPAGIDLRARLGLGRHTLLAEVTTTDGQTYRRLAEFDVAA